jgi:predicted transcriptional regulator
VSFYVLFAHYQQGYDMKQRGSFLITALVLEACKQKRLSRNKIMQELMLSYPRTIKYLDLLVKEDLIDYDASSHTYGITAKGMRPSAICRAG